MRRKRNPPNTVSGNVNWYSHHEEEYGGSLKNKSKGVPVVAQWLTNPTRKHEVVGSIPGLAQRAKDLALP